jgi:hypothetical protein
MTPMRSPKYPYRLDRSDVEKVENEAAAPIPRKTNGGKHVHRVRRSTYEKAMALVHMYRNSCIKLKSENDELKARLKI